MTYSFANLSPADFEDLVRDLASRELGVRFEAFAQGPDGGMDGRHSAGDGATILQAKHYQGSTLAKLKATMKRERPAIDALAPQRYILATSRPLTPPNKSELAKIIGPALGFEDDIWTPADINTLLRKHPDVEKAHIKLWLSGTGMLERVVRAAAHAFTDLTKEEIERKVRIFAPNPSFPASRDKLEAHHVLIISGPPGVGKTTLAEMLAYAYMAEGWEFVAIRSLEDGFAAINDAKNQVFFFDDFLGRVALDARTLASRDTELAKFIGRVRRAKNARFILTTRAHIFQEARLLSESLADRSLDVTQYVLDVGIYTRRVRARILYNHLLTANTPTEHIRALFDSGSLTRIIDHDNYNPRIVQWMTDSLRIADVPAADYPGTFLAALDNPAALWDIAFQKHISRACQNLLLALFFCSEYGVEIEDLKPEFDAIHRHLSEKYNNPFDHNDFDSALRTLEGGFITIRGTRVSFINPSLRDYLTGYLADIDFLEEFAATGRNCGWAERVWQHGSTLQLTGPRKRAFAQSFLPVAERFSLLPVMKPLVNQPGSLRFVDLSNTRRIELLLKWGKASQQGAFIDLALALAAHPAGGFGFWEDAQALVELAVRFKQDPFSPRADEFAAVFESGLIGILSGWVPIGSLEPLFEKIEEAGDALSPEVGQAAREAVKDIIKDVSIYIDHEESESTLEDNVKSIRKLAERIGAEEHLVERAIETINEKASELREKPESESPSFSGKRPEPDAFNDNDLRNLFAPLLEAK